MQTNGAGPRICVFSHNSLMSLISAQFVLNDSITRRSVPSLKAISGYIMQFLVTLVWEVCQIFDVLTTVSCF